MIHQQLILKERQHSMLLLATEIRKSIGSDDWDTHLTHDLYANRVVYRHLLLQVFLFLPNLVL